MIPTKWALSNAIVQAFGSMLNTKQREAAPEQLPQPQPANLLLQDELENESNHCGQPTYALQPVSTNQPSSDEV